MTCMKMPRPHCEAENVQFVQELAEVDGPFESPININFRDLTKLELPCLVWNRGDTSPKKMKITNTGHTVIISGKWKCERPYLSGGPLSGKYVFSQIHFHWGQDDCKGSEHLICGDGFPLEMHVAHFKTEYLTQEHALREKDGMVVVVYLFKLQDEPNQNLKKIINLLPNIKQACTSYAIEPRPILSLCNPFTEDYFMYWGSVVTSTCAHILLWIICREPFGISRDQVNEFRKIMDSTQQPICRNSRDVQPLHCRNVFHVNASENLNEPMLPVKKIVGCFCHDSGENTDAQQQSYVQLEGSIQPSEHDEHSYQAHHHHHHHHAEKVQEVEQIERECHCYHVPEDNQEEVEGSTAEFQNGNNYLCARGMEALTKLSDSPTDCYAKQTLVVHRATVSLTVKRFESDPVGNNRYNEKSLSLKNAHMNLSAKSCCFFPIKEHNYKAPKRKTRQIRSPFYTIRAFSQIMHSLEVLKNQTFKKLKDIESINHDIKGMKTFCHENEDSRWIRKLEKIMRRQRQFTIKSSQGCLSEIKKIAKDCTFGNVLQSKILSVGDNNGKTVWLSNDRRAQGKLPEPKPHKIPVQKVISSKSISEKKSKEIASKTRRLIQSFFEDIQDSNELHEAVKKDLKLKKVNSICSKQTRDSNSVSNMIKGYITQNMFVLGKLGDRFFTEVTADDFEKNDKRWQETKSSGLILPAGITDTRVIPESQIGKAHFEKMQDSNFTYKNDTVTPLHRANVTVELSKTSSSGYQALGRTNTIDTVVYNAICFSDDAKTKPKIEILSDTDSVSRSNKRIKSKKKSENFYPRIDSTEEKFDYSTEEKLKKMSSKLDLHYVHHSTSILSSESNEVQRLIIAKFGEKSYNKTSSNTKTCGIGKKSLDRLHATKSCKQFKGYYIQKKSRTNKMRKRQKSERAGRKSSSSREDSNMTIKNSKWKKVTKARFKLEIQGTSESSDNSEFENSTISPKKKKPKLESVKETSRSFKQFREIQSRDGEIRVIIQSDKFNENQPVSIDVDTQIVKENELPTPMTAEEKLLKKQKPRKKEETKLENASDNLMWPTDVTDLKINCTVNEETKPLPATPKETKPLPATPKETKPLPATPKETKPLPATPKETKPLPATPKETRKKISHAGIQTQTEIKLHRNLSPTHVFSAHRISKRLSVDNKRRSRYELLDKQEEPEDTQKVKEQNKPRTASGGMTESCRPDDEKEIYLPKSKETVTKLAYNVGYFTTTSSQVDEELLPTGQIAECKAKPVLLKRCDADKYQFLQKGSQSQEKIEENPQNVHQTDSNKSFVKDASKGDAMNSKDLQASVTYINLKRNSTSRPHSDETLNSSTRNLKKKSKKRPHCSKRNSRHYIRKNISTFKKPNKSDSKTFNFLNLMDEEQLKIISVNVAKYLQEKLEKEISDDSKTCTINNIEDAVFAQLKSSHEKIEEPIKEPTSLKRKGVKENENVKTREKKTTRPENKTKTAPKKSPGEKKIQKPATALPKPTNNYVKLNKQMAGKKSNLPTPEKQTKPEEVEKPCSEPTKKTEIHKFKTRIPRKQVDKISVQRAPEEPKINSDIPPATRNNKIPVKESRIKRPTVFKKINSKEKDLEITPTSTIPTREPCEVTNEEIPVSCTASQSIEMDKKLLIPVYTLTSSLPGTLEIMKTQNRKVNRYIQDKSDPCLEVCVPEVLYESQRKIPEDRETVFMKELEYFLQLQMYLNNDVSKTFEKPMSCESSVLSLNQLGSSLKENATVEDLPYAESCNKGIILIKKTNMNCSSSCSDLTEDLDKINTLESALNKNGKLEENQTSEIKIQHEYENPVLVISASGEHLEEANSDSTYDCKISITLNTTFAHELDKSLNENKEETQLATISYTPEGNSQHSLVISVSERNSQILFGKSHRRKRKDTEISLEMKQKLLEILEAEIKREVEIKCGRASEHSSGGITFKWDDSDGNNKSHSRESSCDNIDILAQISDTMRQYLQEFREEGQLVEIINEYSNKESKGDAS